MPSSTIEASRIGLGGRWAQTRTDEKKIREIEAKIYRKCFTREPNSNAAIFGERELQPIGCLDGDSPALLRSFGVSSTIYSRDHGMIRPALFSFPRVDTERRLPPRQVPASTLLLISFSKREVNRIQRVSDSSSFHSIAEMVISIRGETIVSRRCSLGSCFSSRQPAQRSSKLLETSDMNLVTTSSAPRGSKRL